MIAVLLITLTACATDMYHKAIQQGQHLCPS